jgi:hypothetical protein
MPATQPTGSKRSQHSWTQTQHAAVQRGESDEREAVRAPRGGRGGAVARLLLRSDRRQDGTVMCVRGSLGRVDGAPHLRQTRMASCKQGPNHTRSRVLPCTEATVPPPPPYKYGVVGDFPCPRRRIM